MSWGCEWHTAWAMMQLQAAAAAGHTHGMLACDMLATWPPQLQLGSEYNVVDGWGDVDTAWPQLQLDSEHNVEDEFREVDVAMELVRVATDGLAVIGHCIRIAEILRKQLKPVIASFSWMQKSSSASPGGSSAAAAAGGEVDEVRAAAALMCVDAVLEEAPRLPLLAVKLLKYLQRLAQDAIVLACSSFINQNMLQSKGIPAALLHRLELAFFPTPLSDDLFSRLGNSKYHMWTPDKKFGDRKHRRRGKCTRIIRTMEAEPLHIYPLGNTTTPEDISLKPKDIYPLEPLHISLKPEDIYPLENTTTPEDMSLKLHIFPPEDIYPLEPLHVYPPEDISLKLQQLEAVLQKHRVYSESLMDDIKKTVFSESLMSF